MRKFLFLYVLFFSFPAFAGGPEEGELFGIQLGEAISLNQFIEPKIDDRVSPNSPLYEFTRYSQKSLKLNEDIQSLGLQGASVFFELGSLKVLSIDAESNYGTWEDAQQQSQFLCETFSKKYGGKCLDTSLLNPEELLANSLWPVEIYSKDFDRKYTLTLHTGRREIPGTQGVITNFLHINYEIFRDRYQECLNSFKDPDYFRLNEGQDPVTECAKLIK